MLLTYDSAEGDHVFSLTMRWHMLAISFMILSRITKTKHFVFALCFILHLGNGLVYTWAVIYKNDYFDYMRKLMTHLIHQNQPLYCSDCLINNLCEITSKKTSQLRITLCEGNLQRASNAASLFVSLHHHVNIKQLIISHCIPMYLVEPWQSLIFSNIFMQCML